MNVNQGWFFQCLNPVDYLIFRSEFSRWRVV